jgi:RNA methyltransferase, TrmH family
MTSEHLRRAGIRGIRSPANALLKVFRRALAEGVTRQGWLAVEGPLLVEEALDAGHGEPRANRAVRVHSVLVARGAAQKFRQLLDRLPEDAEVAEVEDRLFDHVAGTETPQGIAALVELPPHDLDAILTPPDALIVVACRLQDPGNLGTMIRSARALGGSALITLPSTVSPFNPKAVRSSAGAIFQLPVLRGVEPATLARSAGAAGVELVAADRHAPLSVTEADLRGPVALLIGQEAAGLPPEIAREASARVNIPIRAGTDSLNAAVAASILLYEAARQRGFRTSSP